jgi:hypothetical protein
MDFKKLAVECIDLEKFAIGLLDGAVEPAIDKVVADSANLVDDAVKAMVYPPLKIELHKLIAEAVAKLKASV